MYRDKYFKVLGKLPKSQLYLLFKCKCSNFSGNLNLFYF